MIKVIGQNGFLTQSGGAASFVLGMNNTRALLIRPDGRFTDIPTLNMGNRFWNEHLVNDMFDSEDISVFDLIPVVRTMDDGTVGNLGVPESEFKLETYEHTNYSI